MLNNPVLALKQARLKVTPARLAVSALFTPHCRPLNSEEVYQQLKKKNFNQVTVYRTLASLAQVGFLRRVELRRGSTHYELASSHHHHLVCTSCGKMGEFEHCDLQKVFPALLKKLPAFASINEHSLELFGRCKKCPK